MNIILFITIIVLVLIFSHQLIKYFNYSRKKEYFKVELNNQLSGFLDDKDLYNVRFDTSILDLDSEIDKVIQLNPVEYQNFCNRVDMYKKVRSERLGKEQNNLKKNLIMYEDSTNKINYPLVRKEISILKLDRIILTLINIYQFNPHNLKYKINADDRFNEDNLTDTLFFNNVCKNKDQKTESLINFEQIESFRFIQNWILEEISKEAAKPKYAVKYVDSQRYKFKYVKVLDYYIDYNNYLERFLFNGVMFRENKETNFVLHFDIIFDYRNIKYYINDIIILGINLEEYIMFSDLMNKDYDYDKNGIHLSLSEENPGYVSDTYINNYWDTVTNFEKNDTETRKKIDSNLTPKGTCFFKDAYDKNNCISFKEGEGTGIWDTPCKYNEECPFFKKNGNYPNNRGGCLNGYCEMPTNIERIGYKEYNEGILENAVCHNCNYKPGCKGIECSQCCEEQKDNTLYPNLKSPDYAYKNDYKDRIKNSKYFNKNNLSPFKILV
jgi:hypothetical protein